MTSSISTTNPILSTYVEGTVLPAFNVSLDGSGGMRLLIEFQGEVYELSGKQLRRFRIFKLVDGKEDELIKEGATTRRSSQINRWNPSEDGLQWFPDDGTSCSSYGLAFEIEVGKENWQRTCQYPPPRHPLHAD